MNNICTSIMKLALCCILGLIFLVGCGVDKKTLPKITSLEYQMNEGRIVVNALDDVKVVGYLLTYSNDEPKIEDESWKESSIFYEVKVGNAKVWVKDGDGNLAYSEILIEEPIALLAKDYEFLAWHLDESTSKTVDGISYDLTSLKQKYGDLYRFIEPLSKEEVEHRFKYLSEYYAEIFDKGIIEEAVGGITWDKGNSSKDTYTPYVRRSSVVYESMYKQELGDEFKMFSKHIGYIERSGRYYATVTDTMYEKEKMLNNIDSISFEDKNWYVRNYMFLLDLLLSSYKELDTSPTFAISPLE